MDNPWTQLPDEPPFVLPGEKAAIDAFSQRVGNVHTIRMDYLPEPYLGDPKAPIILLSLNPGFADEDRRLFEDPYGRERGRGNLYHAPSAFPFYLLDPRLEFASGAAWWRNRLDALIRIAGDEIVANRVFCVEFFPYHSRRYKDLGHILDSQRYSFHLVEKAIDGRALIIVMRAWKRWCTHVPRLADYDRLHICIDARRPNICPDNLPTGFPAIEQILLE
jgi:hypothetical protein